MWDYNGSMNGRSPAAPPECEIVREVDAILSAWRDRVLRLLYALASLALLPPLAAVFAGIVVPLPWRLRGLLLLGYLALLAATLRPSLSTPRFRAGLLLGLIAATGVIRLAVGQMAGSGRLSLLLLPLLALLLAGPRAGWTATAFSFALYALTPLLLKGGGFLLLGIPPGDADAPLAVWAMQGAFLFLVLLTLMILFTQFLKLQRRTMIAERMALRRLEAEAARRRGLEEAIVRLGEEERRRLGAELHDGLCQHLTAALLRCTALESRREDPDAAELARIRAYVQEAIDTAYEVAKGLCPVGMDPDALLPALERLCEDVRTHSDIDCRLHGARDLAIRDPKHALLLYQIAREAVANAVKHARCDRIAIEIEREGGDLAMHIADDGRGLVPGTAPEAGLGLSIMRHRAGLLGATLRVAAGQSGGMEVVCRAPGLETPR